MCVYTERRGMLQLRKVSKARCFVNFIMKSSCWLSECGSVQWCHYSHLCLKCRRTRSAAKINRQLIFLLVYFYFHMAAVALCAWTVLITLGLKCCWKSMHSYWVIWNFELYLYKSILAKVVNCCCSAFRGQNVFTRIKAKFQAVWNTVWDIFFYYEMGNRNLCHQYWVLAVG